MNRTNQRFWILVNDVQITITNCNLAESQCRALDANLQALLPLVRNESLAAQLRDFLTANCVKEGLLPREIGELANIMDAIRDTEGKLVGLDAL